MNDNVSVNQATTVTLPTAKPEVPLGNLRVYVCGGGATEIFANGIYGKNNLPKGSAILHPVFLDTSRSNLQAHSIASAHVELVRAADGSEIDGSGKKRDENFPLIKPTIPSIISRHKPTEANVVIATTGGGSGNVIAWCLIEELLKAEKPVFAIFIGCYESRISAYNTMRVVQSLEQLVETQKKDLRIIWVDNDPSQTYEDANLAVTQAVKTIAVFTSRQNTGLDTRDVAYALNTSVPLKTKPALGFISVHRDSDMGDIKHADSVISLYKSPMRDPLPLAASYETYGHYTFGDSDASFVKSIHLVVRNDVHFDVFKRAKDIHDKLEELEKARAVTRSTLSEVSGSGSSGGPIF